MNTKTCTRCGETKPLTEFHKDSHKPDGLRPSCKPCTRAAVLANSARNRARTHIDIPAKKVCPRCDIERAAKQFSPNRATKSGLAGWCKTCQRAYLRSRYVPRGEAAAS